jgi:hypothetical protein
MMLNTIVRPISDGRVYFQCGRQDMRRLALIG